LDGTKQGLNSEPNSLVGKADWKEALFGKRLGRRRGSVVGGLGLTPLIIGHQGQKKEVGEEL